MSGACPMRNIAASSSTACSVHLPAMYEHLGTQEHRVDFLRHRPLPAYKKIGTVLANILQFML